MRNVPAFLQKKSRRTNQTTIVDTFMAYQPLLGAWLIELALCLGLGRKLNSGSIPDIFVDDNFIDITGITPLVEHDADDGEMFLSSAHRKLSNAKLERILKSQLSALHKQALPDNLPLFHNIDLLGRILGLSNAEKALLTFAVALSSIPKFHYAIGARSLRVSTQQLAEIVAAISGQSRNETLAAVRANSLLFTTGILQFNSVDRDLEDSLKLMSGLGDLLLFSHVNEEELSNRFLRKATAPSLDLKAFPHLSRDIEALSAYLSRAIQSRDQGVNVLLYGAPGTGKTELAKSLAMAIGVDLYEVDFSDEDGNAIKGEERLRAYNFCQKIVERKTNALLMFDEIEDVFESTNGFMALLFGEGGQLEDKGGGKAWINRTLEINPTPTLWVTNNPYIDKAYLRRFDYSVRFPVPPQKVRMSIARHHLSQFEPTEAWLAGIAANEATTPAQYERAAKLARIASGGDHAWARTLVEQSLDRSATLLDQKRAPCRNVLRTGYDIGFVNVDVNIPQIIEGLKRRPSGTFCFYGHAGTGKSELARHIADEIGKPVLLRRASDILGMYVGESEQNIAAMFSDARQQEAVLVLDEADSFLADRRDAQRSWEVTQVNELLTQMEAFEGIFVCTTNLMQKLDQASLRRFAFKVKFDYLTAKQRREMFLQELTRLGGSMDQSEKCSDMVSRLENLTPGDFSVAVRQFALWDKPVTAGELFAQLRKECAAKESGGKTIGFA